MASKWQSLAIAVFAFTALAINASKSTIDKKKLITIDPLVAEDAAESFEDALKEEEPLLKEDEEKADSVRHKSLVSTQLHLSKVQAGQAPVSLNPFASGAWASDFEKDVADLVLGLSKGELGATPFNASVVSKIADLIEKDMMPKVNAAHEFDQEMVMNLSSRMTECNTTLGADFTSVNTKKVAYETESGLHKECRRIEQDAYTTNQNCHAEWVTKKASKEEACTTWLTAETTYGDQTRAHSMIDKMPSEDVEAYIQRVTADVCGTPVDCATCARDETTNECTPDDGWHGELYDLVTKRVNCETEVSEFNTLTATCKQNDQTWHAKRSECDVIQGRMDMEACDWTLLEKATCTSYIECYTGGVTTEHSGVATIVDQERDRKNEWIGLEKMVCIINIFGNPDGITNEAIDACKNMAHNTGHLNITYPTLVAQENCTHKQLYPSTDDYIAAEFTPLPPDAKGKVDTYTCPGLTEVSVSPGDGSPNTCVCSIVELDGIYSAGALVKCENCTDISKSGDRNSCPTGTKLFSPQSLTDWTTFLDSTRTRGALADPNFIVDVTRAHVSAVNEAIEPMNSLKADNADLPYMSSKWVTSDGSPWYFQNDTGTVPTIDAANTVNCYMDLYGLRDTTDRYLTATHADVTLKVDGCAYHSKSYYCQPEHLDLTPNAGSPSGCTCKKVQLVGTSGFSAHLLLKCEGCLSVRSSKQTNSCPASTKLFSPRTRADWKTFLDSATAVRAPHWIVDITRPQNGCGETVEGAGCGDFAMKSEAPEMATWVTQDHSAWWLRDTGSSTWLDSNEYQADCYMNLFSFSNEDNIAWETKNTTRETALPTASAAGHPQCEFYSSSYYCQSFEHTTTTTTLPARCSSVYTDNSQCPDGTHVLVDDPASTDCDGNPCVDNAANDALCCQEATCTVPTTEGYNTAGAGGTLTWAGFSPTGVTCAEGFEGSVSYTVCSENRGAYSVSGCETTTTTTTTTTTVAILCGTTTGYAAEEAIVDRCDETVHRIREWGGGEKTKDECYEECTNEATCAVMMYREANGRCQLTNGCTTKMADGTDGQPNWVIASKADGCEATIACGTTSGYAAEEAIVDRCDESVHRIREFAVGGKTKDECYEECTNEATCEVMMYREANSRCGLMNGCTTKLADGTDGQPNWVIASKDSGC